MGRDTIKISVRIDSELVAWVDEQVSVKKREGKSGADRTREFEIALRQRMISLMSPPQRQKIYKALGMDFKEPGPAKQSPALEQLTGDRQASLEME